MDFEVISTNVVVLANQHNPSILHDAFLRQANVVDSGWGDPLPDALSTPALSQVGYANGIQFLVQAERLQVVDNLPPRECAQSKVAEVAGRYVAALPHVRYLAVGINFAVFAPRQGAEGLLIERFLKAGPWNKGDLCLRTADIRLAYVMDAVRVRLALAAATRKREEGREEPGVSVDGNYHVAFGANEVPLDAARRVLGLYSERCAHFFATLATVFGEG